MMGGGCARLLGCVAAFCQCHLDVGDLPDGIFGSLLVAAVSSLNES